MSELFQQVSPTLTVGPVPSGGDISGPYKVTRLNRPGKPARYDVEYSPRPPGGRGEIPEPLIVAASDARGEADALAAMLNQAHCFGVAAEGERIRRMLNLGPRGG